MKATGIANFHTLTSKQPIRCQNPSEIDLPFLAFLAKNAKNAKNELTVQACCCLFSPVFHTTPPLIINGAIVCVGVLVPSPPCLAKTHISQSKFRQLEESKK